jgi:hypothetical protein
LFPNGDDPKLMKEHLKHPDAIRDEVYHWANAIKHKIWYSKLVESGLQTMTRKMAVGYMLSPKNHLLLTELVPTTGPIPSWWTTKSFSFPQAQSRQNERQSQEQTKIRQFLFCFSFGYIGSGIGRAISHAIVLSLSLVSLV